MANEAETTRHAPLARGFTLVDATGVMLGRPIPHIQQDEQVLVPFTYRNAVAIVPGSRARDLVVSLEETGLEGTRISFLRLDSASLSESEDATPPSQNVSARSERRSERTVIVGAIVGGIIGALFVGLLVLALGSGGTASLGGALGGLALGAALGALVSGFTRLGASDAWERSLHIDPDSPAAIGVHVDSDEALPRLVDVLGPTRVWVFAHDGSVLRRP